MSTSTPWGTAQTSNKIAPGIMSYTTAGHGGIHLSPSRNAEVPDYMRSDDGWYEEDCDWAIPALIFPLPFFKYEESWRSDFDQARSWEAVVSTLRNWRPDAYERFFGVKIKKGESFTRENPLNIKFR